MSYLYEGSYELALGDLERSLHLSEELGFDFDVASTKHNIGIVHSRRGDLASALQLFEDSEAEFEKFTGSKAEVQVSHCEALLSAGLFREASSMALDVSSQLHQAGLAEDEAEAMLVAAQAALASNEGRQARERSAAAGDLFDRQGRQAWRSAARVVEVQARYMMGEKSPHLRLAALAMAQHLDDKRQLVPAAEASMVAGRIALDLGMLDEAAEDFSTITRIAVGPIEVRLNGYLAEALLAKANGKSEDVESVARAGMALLESYRATIGATDIRSGIGRHSLELSDLGIDAAIESGNPRRVFSWMERTRARALVHRPVKPTEDSDQQRDLIDLRTTSERLLVAEGREALNLSKTQRDLQDSIRRRSRKVSAGGRPDVEVALAGAIGELLGDRTLVEFGSHDGDAVAIQVKSGRFTLKRLGQSAMVRKELESLRFVLRRLAQGRGSIEMVEEIGRRLDQELFGSLDLSGEPLVIVPTPALHATPWWVLPTCRSQPTTVAPSSDLWHRASRRTPLVGAALIVAGPDLVHADDEVTEVSSLYHDPMLLKSGRSTAAEVSRRMTEARLAHVASHARFESENPMFSALSLADGDLNVYDIERLSRTPETVVLSACDSGFSEAYAGEELMGLTSSLMSLGTRTVISSVGLVPDSEATKNLMVHFHRGLISGMDPADSLHKAQSALSATDAGFVAAASFICVGAGWH
jgi:tetratricopeptide (TPR) repeat protein